MPLASIFCRISLETSLGTSGELSSLGELWAGDSFFAPLRRVCGASWEKAGRRRCVRAESDPSTKGRRVSSEMLNLMRVSVRSGGDYTPEERGFSTALRVLDEGMGRSQYGFRNLLDYNIKLHYLRELCRGTAGQDG
jgi:hypothetical protein